MTIKDLEELGFERTDVPFERSGAEPFYYYTLYVTGGVGLISDIIEEGQEEIEIVFFEDANNKPLTKRLIEELIKWKDSE